MECLTEPDNESYSYQINGSRNKLSNSMMITRSRNLQDTKFVIYYIQLVAFELQIQCFLSLASINSSLSSELNEYL